MVFDTDKLEPGYYGISAGKTLYKLSLKADLPLWSRSYNLMTGEVHYPTNRDRLRHMTDEELAEFLAKNQKIGDVEQREAGYRQLWLDWLKQEVESDG